MNIHKFILGENMEKKYDKVLFLAVILLLFFGVIMIYSASSIWAEYKFNDSFRYVKQQLLFLLLKKSKTWTEKS